MKTLHKKLFFSSVGLAAILFVAIASAKIAANKSEAMAIVVQDTVETINIDTAKLKLFAMAGKAIDFNAGELTLSGTLSVHDGNDSSVNVDNAAYCFIKKDSSFYYKMNLVEMINTNTYCVQVDGQQKKIMLSPHKSINPQFMFPQIEKLVSSLREERYRVVEMTAPEGFRKISIINPHHVTCKEYSITFNRDTFKPTEVFIRLSNLDDPLNSKMDKTILMRYSERSNLNETALLSIERILAKSDHGFKAVHDYTGYEVIEIGR
ncbi:hypothetical protein [Pedobacter sp. KLB.chiD]|uniref:hypothetical protein n=1 Tax=Pedobacter sp. KLB.chiD TaxID=3387402 RepID=UPI00399A038B